MNPRHFLPLVGAVQGAWLYWLHKAVDRKFWPFADLPSLGVVGALGFGVPALIYLSEDAGLSPRLRALLVAMVSLIYALLGAYGGWVSGDVLVGNGPSHAASALGAAILGFVVVPLAAGWNPTAGSAAGRFDYLTLFRIAWRNGVLCFATAALVGVFWLVLMAGAFLIKSLGLDYILEFIRKPEFFIPATCIAAGEAWALGLARAELLVSLRRFWMVLTAWFLPILLCFAVVWVAAMPFTGLEELFATRTAGLFLLWFTALAITFMNSAWQDGRESVYAPPVQRVVALLWLTLPVVIVVAGAAIARRVIQYGWTDDRIWGAFVWILAAGYVSGYAASWLPRWRHRGWMAAVGSTNVVVALIMVAGLALLLSPVLDPRRVSVADQMARLASGEVKADAFDYAYLRFHAGRWGQQALNELAAGSNELAASRAKQSLAQSSPYGNFAAQSLERDAARARIRVLPHVNATVLDDALIDRIRDVKADYPERQCLAPERKCLAWVRDLDKDGSDDVLLVSYQNINEYPTVSLYSGRDGWKRVSVTNASVQAGKWVQALERGEVKVEVPRWPDVVVGSEKMRVTDLR